MRCPGGPEGPPHTSMRCLGGPERAALHFDAMPAVLKRPPYVRSAVVARPFQGRDTLKSNGAVALLPATFGLRLLGMPYSFQLTADLLSDAAQRATNYLERVRDRRV